MLALLLSQLACTGAPVGDTGPDTVEDDAPSGLECDTLEIRVQGDDPPSVGDEWTAYLWCDDTLLTGATRMLFDPTDIATVSANTATFVHSGDATLTLQVGARRQTRDLTVMDAR